MSREHFIIKINNKARTKCNDMFYQTLLEQIEAEYPGIYYSFAVGGISFPKLIQSVNTALNKDKAHTLNNTQTAIKEKIDHLLKYNYII